MMLNLPKYCINVKEKLLVSFSGGLTSAFMLWWILKNWSEKYEILVVFANTGKENEGTLEFVRECEIQFGCKIIWVESVPISKKGWVVTHKIVTFETASRNGEPFELMISYLGIPSASAPFCSYQLKRLAIISYAKSLGWKDYYTAIGIRADEIDRINPQYKKLKILYPLISEKPINKKQVTGWWKVQPFILNIPYGLGNCDNCNKKGIKTLVYNAIHYPETFQWWQLMTDRFGHLAPREAMQKMTPPFNFYRGNMSPIDIFRVAEMEARQLDLFAENERLDGCSESCEVF